MKRAGGTRGLAPRLVLAIWIACFLIGTVNHVRALLAHGWLPYDFAPLPFNAFWTALTFVDPLAAALLVWRRNAGIALGLCVMLSDVAVNSWIAATHGLGGVAGPLQLQTLFLGFTIGSFRLIWLGRGTAAPGAPD